MPSPLLASDADTQATDERADRAAFNTYVEQLIRMERARGTKKPWSFSGSASYGHDDNVALNSSRVGDWFHQENTRLVLAVPHQGLWNVFGPGEIGIEGNAEYRDYDLRQSFVHYRAGARPFVTTQLAGGLADFSYDAKWLGYVHNRNLDYLRHRLTSGLKWKISSALSHRPYFSYSLKRYLDRRASQDSGVFDDSRREDIAYEAGHQLFFTLSKSMRAVLTLSWEKNDGNDLFLKFNDYDRYSADGAVEWRLAEKILTVLKGGYDFTDYEERLIAAGSAETETNDYFYLSANLFYSLTQNLRFGVTYLYGQNYSNKPSQEYSFSNSTAGLYFNF